MSPKPNSIDYRLDQYANHVAMFNLTAEHRQCDIIVTSLVETTDQLSTLPDSLGTAENLSAVTEYSHPLESLMAQDCLLSSPSVAVDDTVDPIIAELPVANTPVLQYGQQLMEHIFSTFTYQSGFSNLVTPLADIIQARKGVCQDFAHLAIAVLRKQGIPARYVSGYLETLPPPGEVKLQGADASHAWFSIYAANSGWWDFDPTNNKRPDKQYITTAWGRDYDDVVPVKGVVYGGGAHTLSVEVDVNRTESTPSLIKRD